MKENVEQGVPPVVAPPTGAGSYAEPPVPGPGMTVPDAYEVMATQVGFVPNVKKSDNVFQLRAIAVTCLVTTPLGLLAPVGLPVYAKLLLGLLAGILLGSAVSGFLLMIKGMKGN